MKVGGIIALIFGVLNLIVGIGGLSTQYADQATGKIGFGNKKKVKQRSKSNFKTKEPARLKIKNLPLKRIASGGRKK